MCGRFTLFTAIAILKEFFQIDEITVKLQPHYNIAPGQEIAVIPNLEKRSLQMHKWGLVPHWAKDTKIGYKMINARAETVAEKPSFREPFKKRRCIIPADGFYEWRKDGASKTPMFIRLRSGKPFALAGLWDVWKSPEGKAIATCTILTTRPNEMMATIHDRMPVILTPEQFNVWLDPNPRDPRDLKGFLEPYSADEMESFPVSKMVNTPANDSPDCAKPA